MAFEITTQALRADQLPTHKADIASAAQELIDEVHSSWKKGKCYKYQLQHNPTLDTESVAVQTYSTTRAGEYWLSRVSEHRLEPAVYERLVKELNGSVRDGDGWTLPDRSARSRREIDYIEVLSRVDVAQTLESGWVLVNLEYELGKPLTTREFNEWVYVLEPTRDAQRERSFVVSVVADAPLHDSVAHTPAVYASVEQLDYDYESQKLIWTMATTSDAGGNVPKWIQNTMIAKAVSKDVGYCFEWLAKNMEAEK
ncbi:LAQU0S04e05578g1_1 [Lachancea quebecensis]|uniref:LAQU0S04e05578g1_1 n=1 Tax=Lachancea quebecensis TaxID=1654605 RepID=A0A0P1KZL8_9SACH|nr:LAQU0S04e05578g1_1 [Lachancea quebecensis]